MNIFNLKLDLVYTLPTTRKISHHVFNWLIILADPVCDQGGHVPTLKLKKNIVGIVITPFLPTGFSRVSARKTGQPGPSQHGPMKPHHGKYSHEEGPGHISQGLTKFD